MKTQILDAIGESAVHPARINLDSRECTLGDTVVKEGEYLSLDGNSGAVHLGRLDPAKNWALAPGFFLCSVRAGRG